MYTSEGLHLEQQSLSWLSLQSLILVVKKTRLSAFEKRSEFSFSLAPRIGTTSLIVSLTLLESKPPVGYE